MNKQLFSVSEFNYYVKQYIETHEPLQNIWLTGEISNVKHYHQGGQIYFTLNDGESELNCLMYSSSMKRIKTELKNGEAVNVLGKLITFPKKGKLMFQAAYIESTGKGLLSKEFERLKKVLINEGIFALKNETHIPKYPETIAVVTSYDSAAMWDFIKQKQTHFNHVSLIVSPATMQGASSPKSIIESLEAINTIDSIDLVVIIRGGGSAEDLMSFNDESLLRYIASYKKPIITGIGHETDITLSDFAANRFAPTPTAVARLISEHFQAIPSQLDAILHLGNNIKQRILYKKETLRINLNSLDKLMEYKVNTNKHTITQLFPRIDALNPLHKLRQGFSITTLEKTSLPISTIKEIYIEDIIVTNLIDGKIESKVIKVNEIRR